MELIIRLSNFQINQMKPGNQQTISPNDAEEPVRPDPENRAPRGTMGGKPVFTMPVKTVINFDSGFKHKRLCDGPTFSAGTCCVYSCLYCYVPSAMEKLIGGKARAKNPALMGIRGEHADIVVRRQNAVEIVRRQLSNKDGTPKFKGQDLRRSAETPLQGEAVIYASPLVDVAANLELVEETIEICKVILELTHWTIRLLSKSHLLPQIASRLDNWLPERSSPIWQPGGMKPVRHRLIFGVSTGTMDDQLARVIEQGTPNVSMRLKSLRWLQDNGFRTFGMICPILPQTSPRNLAVFAQNMADALPAYKAEHVWAEAINVRGESLVRTLHGLTGAGFSAEAAALEKVMGDKLAWENYARETYEALAKVISADRLRWLQYTSKDTDAWWRDQPGVVCL